jgi:hypothetical protein
MLKGPREGPEAAPPSNTDQILSLAKLLVVCMCMLWRQDCDAIVPMTELVVDIPEFKPCPNQGEKK